ncbi:DUF7504 family protein [Natronococcus wangiae]|uniref:DUF7504 family protein n=1 Tax=Natronococcus wangiae TaxID=3068275 RepID=UPI00273D17FF|nr:HalOD1 output domain-containing protein [Natronococcus sp. AD5]
MSVIVRDDGYVMTYLSAQTPNQLEPLIELEHDWSGPASLSWSIGRAIVTARDGAVEASAVDPVFEVVETLCEYIDADALDRVLRPSRDSDTATSRLLLSVDGYEVTVTADGSIAVEPSLSVLKRSGSALLVTGTAPESGFDRTAAMLLGTPERNRTPVFVYYGQDIAAARHRLSRAEYDPAVGTVLDCQTATARTTASAAGGNNHGPHQPDGDATPTVVPISGGIEAIPEAVRETAATTGPFDPGQLRVEIDSVDSMLASTTLEKTHRTLDGISRVIRTHRGIGHFLLPASVDDDTVASLVPMFDGVVEIRVGEAELEQQWRLTTTGYETTWFPFE